MPKGIYKRNQSVVERFLSHVDKNGSTMPGMTTCCWPFLGSGIGKWFRNPLGQWVRYCSFINFRDVNGKRETRTHRIALILLKRKGKPIPKGKQVNHKCHNPPCGRPSHLKLGNHKKNMRDKVEAGRASRTGSKRGLVDLRPSHVTSAYSSLTKRQVRRIRKLYATGNWTMKKLAKKFNISVGTVWFIIHYLTWKNI